jgi:heme ABC exporter ATP-binding subunit CcmA
VSEPALRAVGLGKRFGRAVALEDVALELAAGESLAVLGPNGAGKSTLLRLIAGLARPTSGALFVDGTPAHRAQARARIGFIGHASLLYAALTARENLVFAARLQRLRDGSARAQRLLEAGGLSRVADLPVAGLSRGTAQRVAIARGLVHDPALVLLDEPFAGLDPRAAAGLADHLARLRAAGRTLVIVTHDPARAAQLADRAIVLGGGRIVFEQRCTPAGAEALERAVLAASDAGA